jgi:hypothetical protein
VNAAAQVSEDKRPGNIKPYVGIVWERCDAVDKMAIDEPTV